MTADTLRNLGYVNVFLDKGDPKHILLDGNLDHPSVKGRSEEGENFAFDAAFAILLLLLFN